jgi:hypothetical protein
MAAHTASRTLVKSSPELWAECSEAASLAKHLGAFGEIRITKVEPETAVAWEGDAASGTVRLEPSGWGTRVTLTATARTRGPAEASAGTLQQASEPDREQVLAPRPGALARLFSLILRRSEPPPAQRASGQAAVLMAEPGPSAEARAPVCSASPALDAALDSLGRAHHRPYSRT